MRMTTNDAGGAPDRVEAGLTVGIATRRQASIRRGRTVLRRGPVATGLAIVALSLAAAIAIAAPAANAPGADGAAPAPSAASAAVPVGTAPAGAAATSGAPQASNGDDDAARPPPPPANAPRRSPDIFVPSESVPEDRPVAFPVDI